VRTSNGERRGKNSAQRLSRARANTGSFDSVSGLASESIHSAQDDRVEVRRDLNLFRALETYEYRLGNRSALEWVIDQYQVPTDKRSGITNDPNRGNDPTYILRFFGRDHGELETVSIIGSLPPLETPEIASASAAE
jgi:hypothetical protein